MEVNCETLAVMGATLANGGMCPTTGKIPKYALKIYDQFAQKTS